MEKVEVGFRVYKVTKDAIFIDSLKYNSRINGASRIRIKIDNSTVYPVETTLARWCVDMILKYKPDCLYLEYKNEKFDFLPKYNYLLIRDIILHRPTRFEKTMVPIEIQLPESWYDSEIINGYFVSREKKELWAIELDMLAKLQKVCDKHKINWWVDAGTLLGAVRHNGFIPWDDDIDVVMLRQDYDRFLEECSGEFTGNYFLQNEKTDTSVYCHTKLRRTDTTCILAHDVPAGFDFNQGIFIDIFVLDYVPNDEDEYNKFINHIWLMKQDLLFLRNRHWNCERWNTKLIDRIKELEADYEKLRRSIEDTGIVANLGLPSLQQDIRKTTDEFKNTLYMDFAILKVPVPSGYHSILKRLYGDYMKPVQLKSNHGQMFVDTHVSYKNSPLLKATTGDDFTNTNQWCDYDTYVSYKYGWDNN